MSNDVAASTSQKITPDQIRSKFHALGGEVESTAAAAKSTAVTVAAAIGTVVVLGVFLLGRSRGRKRTTIVEVRRV